MMKGNHGPTESLHAGALTCNWGAFDHVSHASQVRVCIYTLCNALTNIIYTLLLVLVTSVCVCSGGTKGGGQEEHSPPPPTWPAR